MEDKVIECDFTAKPECEPEVGEKVEVAPVNEFLGRLMAWVQQTMTEYQNFPLTDLLNALNTCALAYLININNLEEQKRYLEWVYKACVAEVEKVAKLIEEKKVVAEKDYIQPSPSAIIDY